MTRPRILITNDDGIHAPGLRNLWEALAPIADVTIVAPADEKSGCGLSITTLHPLHSRSIPGFGDTEAWSISGTPADCVKMALGVILDETPDLVVSGINRGSNAGRNVLYSGTVAAVIEAAHRGIPGLALSCDGYTAPRFDVAVKYVADLVHYLLNDPLPEGSLLNVNFPDIDAQKIDEPKGLRFARQARQYWGDSPEGRLHPVEGTTYHWLGGEIRYFDEEPDSDIALLEEGYIAAVPLSVSDLTNQAELTRRQACFADAINKGAHSSSPQ